MKKSKFRLMALMMALLLTLTSCSRESSLAPAETLPPPSAPYAAPTDDTGLDYERDVALYLPAKNGQTMLCFWRTAALRYDQMPAEAVLQLLLQEEGDGSAVPLKDYGNVSLAQGSAITTAGHVCTVNLSSAALQMGIHELYMVCLSIATTLCALPDVRFVNILVAGNPVAMDVQNLLPLGALSSAEGENLVTRWEQLVAQRTGAGGIAAQTPLSSAAVLYFPLKSGSGITCEVRQLSFDGQNAQQLVYGLLDALSAGANDAANIPDMPDLRTMLLMAPEVTTLSSGRQSAAINLVPDALQRISSAGIDPVCFFAALTMTLTSYIPSLEQVVYRVGDSALTSLYSTIHGTIVLPGGMMTRANFGGLLTDEAVCYLSNGEKLRQGRLNLPASEACSPRALLTAVLATEGFPAGAGLLKRIFSPISRPFTICCARILPLTGSLRSLLNCVCVIQLLLKPKDLPHFCDLFHFLRFLLSIFFGKGSCVHFSKRMVCQHYIFRTHDFRYLPPLLFLFQYFYITWV